MRLQAVVQLYGGGAGSGCVPDVAESHGGKCGRPPGDGKAAETAGPKEKSADAGSRDFTLPNGRKISISHDRATQDKQLEKIRQEELAKLPERIRSAFQQGIPTEQFMRHDNIWEPQRELIHSKIVGDILSGHERQAEPQIILTGGGAASGKSTAANIAKAQLQDTVYINPDDIRAMLPEYGALAGGNQVHLLNEEAGDVRDQAIAEAKARGLNIVLDGVGSPSAAMTLDGLESQGYKVGYYFTYRDVEEALPSAADRPYHAKELADLRINPESQIRSSHDKARTAFPIIAKPGRELRVYGCCTPALKKLVYWRTADGQVKVHDKAGLEVVLNGGKVKIPKNIFTS